MLHPTDVVVLFANMLTACLMAASVKYDRHFLLAYLFGQGFTCMGQVSLPMRTDQRTFSQVVPFVAFYVVQVILFGAIIVLDDGDSKRFSTLLWCGGIGSSL